MVIWFFNLSPPKLYSQVGANPTIVLDLLIGQLPSTGELLYIPPGFPGYVVILPEAPEGGI